MTYYKLVFIKTTYYLLLYCKLIFKTVDGPKSLFWFTKIRSVMYHENRLETRSLNGFKVLLFCILNIFELGYMLVKFSQRILYFKILQFDELLSK